jgi:hypothetical protein
LHSRGSRSQGTNHVAARKALAHKQAPIPSLQSVHEEIPEFVESIFAKMTAKDPADRFQVATELITALNGKVPGQVVVR